MTEKAKAYTSVTADDWVIADPDPTPRTAATARDALADALMTSYLDERYHGTFLTRADAILDALPDGWTLAAAEAPGRVAATPRTAATARERVDVDAVIRNWWNDGPRKTWRKDFADPDTRRDWLEELGRQMTRALAAAEAPGRMALPDGYVWCDHCTGQGVLSKETPPEPTLAAPAPTPSEPVERVPEELRKWLLAVDKVHTGTVPGGLRLRHGRCTTCWMLKVGLDAHPTPATRDE